MLELNKKYKLNIKDFLDIFLKRKWYFIISFILILIIGLAFTFKSTPLYRTTSILKPLDNYYNSKIYEYYPQDSEKLWILPTSIRAEDYDKIKMKEIFNDIRSDNFLNLVIKDVNSKYTLDQLKNKITILIDNENKILRIYFDDEKPDISFELNNLLVSKYIDFKNNLALSQYEDLLLKINNEIIKINNELKQENINYDSKKSVLNSLEEMKFNLENNKDLLVNKVFIYENPQVPSKPYNINYVRNIILVLIIAIIFGIAITYLPNILIPFKK